MRRSRVYRHMLPILRDVAAQHGYALAVHGSMERDLDVIAAPWIEKVSAPEVLADAMALAVTGKIVRDTPEREAARLPKPHGRKAFTIIFGLWNFKPMGGGSMGTFIDLSVMPSDQ